MKKKTAIQLSKIVCGIFIAISLFVYVCPLVTGVRVSAETLRTILCNNVSETTAVGSVGAMSTSADCYRSHSVIAGYLVSIVQQHDVRFLAVFFLGFAAFFVFIFLHYFIRASFFDISRWRPPGRSWRRYCALTRVHIRKKISAWLAIMRNDTAASLAL